jgi:hypothetical protein
LGRDEIDLRKDVRNAMCDNDIRHDERSLLRDQIFYLLGEMEVAFERGSVYLSQRDAAVLLTRLDMLVTITKERS